MLVHYFFERCSLYMNECYLLEFDICVFVSLLTFIVPNAYVLICELSFSIY